MDNIKTGILIKNLRKEKGLTQKDLADQLHITDRAISKWERGLCAPDISALEPLANILGITITELITGQRIETSETVKEIEESVQEVIAYSEREITNKTSLLKRKYFIGFSIFIVSVFTICIAFLWWTGYFNIIERSTSPNEEIQLIIYNRDVADQRFSSHPAVTVKSFGSEISATVYNGSYQGVYWSPDSSKYILSFSDADNFTQLILNNIKNSNSSNLNAYLSLGVEINELANYELEYDESPLPNIQYQFLQWSLDSNFILIYYSFTDADKTNHDGYFWYSCIDGSISNTLEIQLPLK